MTDMNSDSGPQNAQGVAQLSAASESMLPLLLKNAENKDEGVRTVDAGI